ncbi:unnamed protein product [Rhizophagus irregularis]|nr:unnamed protein product [Rhizophagus irregularis]
MDNFLDRRIRKALVKILARRRNKEKKIQRESATKSPDITPEPAYVIETNNDDNLDKPRNQNISEKSELFSNFVNKIHNFYDQNNDKSIEDNQLNCDLFFRKDLPEDDNFTVLSEQAVECDLMQQLSVPSTSIDTEISLIPPVINKKQQFSVTAECIVYMFQKAVRSGYEEILPLINASEAQEQSLDSVEVSKSTPPISQPESPVHDRIYFCNKTLDQYPNLYREFSSEDLIILKLPTRKYAHYAS